MSKRKIPKEAETEKEAVNQFANAFAEWERRYREEREKFIADFRKLLVELNVWQHIQASLPASEEAITASADASPK